MSRIICALIIVLLVSCNEANKNGAAEQGQAVVKPASTGQGADSSFFVKHPLVSLMRKTPVEIGCMLQTEFKYRDSVFNCDNANYVNKGDPCKKVDEYYEGVIIPEALIKKINPLIKDIKLDFEHGNLREIAITFEDSLLKSKIKEMFALPEQGKFPNNVTDIDYGENVFSKHKPVNPNYTKWLSVTGFEHVGAGDADCK